MDAVCGQDSGKAGWLEGIVKKHELSLRRMCFLYLRDLSLAEDAVQETFVKAYQRAESFRGECSEETWLMRIAINTCKDMRRGAWFRYVERTIALDMLPEPVQPCTEDDSLLTIEVMKLPRKQLEAVLLYHYQGMTVYETAQALGITAPSLSARLKKAYDKLRSTLKGA